MSIKSLALSSGLSGRQTIGLYLFALVDPLWRLPWYARRLHWRMVRPLQLICRRFARVVYYFHPDASGFCFCCIALRDGIEAGALGVADVARMASCGHIRVRVIRSDESDARS